MGVGSKPGLALAAALVLAVCLLACGSGGSLGSTRTGDGRAAARPEPERVALPDLRGERFNRAVAELHRLGLQPATPHFSGTIGNPNYRGGDCIRVQTQAPPPGRKVATGTAVAVVIEACPRAHPDYGSG